MCVVKWIASITLSMMAFPAMHAEPHCPGNVASLRLRLVESSQMIVPVVINHTGPYDFLIDTGSQITIVDPALAAELHLNIQGTAGVVRVGSHTRDSFAEVDSLQAGSQSIEKLPIVIQNLESLQAADPHIRGILGGNFLRHFDVLLDYAHSMLCLDDAKAMQQKVRGEHIALVTPDPQGEALATEPLIARVRLSGIANRQLLLLLDSGTNVLFLYHADKFSTREARLSEQLRNRSADGVERIFTVSPPQDMEIGSLVFHQIRFATLANAEKDAPTIAVDGMLPTGIFRSVYISYAERFVVVQPW